LSYGILCHMQHSWHPLWTNLNLWPKAITTKQQTSALLMFLLFSSVFQFRWLNIDVTLLVLWCLFVTYWAALLCTLSILSMCCLVYLVKQPIMHTRNSNILQYQLFNTRTNYFKYSYFPHTVVLWMVMITCRAQRSANRQKFLKRVQII
jgi:hypothetical protein